MSMAAASSLDLLPPSRFFAPDSIPLLPKETRQIGAHKHSQRNACRSHLTGGGGVA